MGLFNLSKKGDLPNPPGELPEILKRLEKITTNREAEEKVRRTGNIFTSQEDLVLGPPDIANKEDVLLLSRLLGKLNNERNDRNITQINIISHLFRELKFSKYKLSDEEFHELVVNWKNSGDYCFRWSATRLFAIILSRVKAGGVSTVLEQTAQLLVAPEDTYTYAEQRQLNQRIELLLQKDQSVGLSKHDDWGGSVIMFIDSIDNETHKKNWINLLNHCLEPDSKSTPSAKWLAKSEELLKETGHEEFSTRLLEWLAFNKNLIVSIHKNERKDFLREVNHNALKSLIWCCGFIKNNALLTAIDEYALVAYKKKPGTGPISARTGTACMHVFSMLPFKEGVTRLMKFRNKIVNNTILKSIDRIIAEVAEENGYSRDLIEEIGVMDFGLDENGEKRIQLGTASCTVSVKSTSDVSVQWAKDGKPQKSVPANVKSEYASVLKELKNDIKEIENQLQVQKNRIENYYLGQKTWRYADWIENYFRHPLVKIIAGKLIWNFKKENEWEAAFLDDGQFRNVLGQPLAWINDTTEIELWHPINAAQHEIVAWRNFVERREIMQPFKQAYREIYILTDAEIATNTYSNRFAAHIVRQHQFAALCRQRGWQYHLMGQWDSHNTPSIELPQWDIRAEYYVDSDWNGNANEVGIFIHIATDQVRFYRGRQQLDLIDVPRLVFSEIMRDVDLFVGVTSIGNDPEWADIGDTRANNYWREYSFGDLSESAKVRSEALQKLIPRLKIASQCSFDGKYLIVKGHIRTYKIHMGSGNILMEPDNQYLCIVPGDRYSKASERVYLPFEGDGLLSIIVSKALLLADDTVIKDETINRQINRK